MFTHLHSPRSQRYAMTNPTQDDPDESEIPAIIEASSEPILPGNIRIRATPTTAIMPAFPLISAADAETSKTPDDELEISLDFQFDAFRPSDYLRFTNGYLRDRPGERTQYVKFSLHLVHLPIVNPTLYSHLSYLTTTLVLQLASPSALHPQC
jgi:hypothetical protein